MKSRVIALALGAFSPLLAHAASSAPAPQFGSFGIDLGARDIATRPGDDFWAYANGGWSARTVIDGDAEAVGVAPALAREGQSRVRALLEDLAKRDDTAPNDRKLGDLYASWMARGEVEARGLRPASPYLARIARATTPKALQSVMADVGYAGPIVFGVAADPSDPTRNIVTVGQGGLGLPRDYYLNNQPRYVAIRRDYTRYVTRILKAGGFADPAPKAAAIVALETRLAGSQSTPAEQRDDSRSLRLTRAALQARIPQWDWTRALAAAGLEDASELLVSDEAALLDLGARLVQEPSSLWRDYLAYRFLSTHAEQLPETFASAHFAFYSTALMRVAAPPPRWRRGVTLMTWNGWGTRSARPMSRDTSRRTPSVRSA